MRSGGLTSVPTSRYNKIMRSTSMVEARDFNPVECRVRFPVGAPYSDERVCL